jgi:hypothetical protein
MYAHLLAMGGGNVDEVTDEIPTKPSKGSTKGAAATSANTTIYPTTTQSTSSMIPSLSSFASAIPHSSLYVLPYVTQAQVNQVQC